MRILCVKRALLVPSAVIHRSFVWKKRHRPHEVEESLAKGLEKTVDGGVERRVVAPHLVHALDGVDDRGVVFSAEALANLR
jgi:hypothetical protein